MSAAFARAARITERLETAELADKPDDATAGQRLSYWASGRVQGGLDYSHERWGVTTPVLRLILGESDESLRARLGEAEWEAEFKRAHDQAPPATDVPEADGLGAATPVQFLWGYFRHRLERELDVEPYAVRADAFLQDGPPWTIIGQVARATAQELRLWVESGRDPESFAGQFDDAAACVQFFETYPVLARSLTEQLTFWLDARLELAARLRRDLAQIQERFGAGTNVSHVHTNAGDTHNLGRSVAILEFDNGAKVVYKPRSFGLDSYLHSFVERLHVKRAPLRVPAILDKGRYGWAEFIEPAYCEEEELDDFYYRQGALAAIFLVHGSTDFHFENMIAAGAYPVPIDMETLLQPRLPRPEAPPIPLSEELLKLVREGVLGSALLPRAVQIGDSTLDLSGMGAVENQLSPVAEPTINGWGTRNVHVARERFEIAPGRNVPVSNERARFAEEHAAEIVAGFRDTYDAIRKRLGDTSSVATIAPISGSLLTRVVLRPTMQYAKLLLESRHPDLLEDALDRSFFWEALTVSKAATDLPTAVIDYEIDCLERGDVPAFYCRADSKDLVDVEGQVISAEFFANSPIDEVQTRLRELGDRDLARQTWLVRASLRASARVETRDTRASDPTSDRTGDPDVLSLVDAITTDLLSAAVESDDGQLFWPTIRQLDADASTVWPSGDDLGNGRGGAVLYLGVVGDLLGRQDLIRTSQICHDHMWSSLEGAAARGEKAWIDVGAFSSLAALLAYEECMTFKGEVDYHVPSDALLGAIVSSFADSQANDYFLGPAGLIPHMESWYERTGLSDIRQISERCVQYTLSTARIRDDAEVSGVGLPDREPIGVAHGLTGLTLGLSSYSGQAYRQDVREFISHAWRAEDRLALTYEPSATSLGGGWCSGSIGIRSARGFVREALGIRDATGPLDESLGGIPTRLALSQDLTICHGRSGALMSVAPDLNTAELALIRRQFVHDAINQVEAHRLLATPGAIDGSTGVGLAALAIEGKFDMALLYRAWATT